MKLQSPTRAAALALGGALLLTSCGGGGSVNLPTANPSRTTSESATVALPTASLPTVTLPTVTLPTRTTSAIEPTAEPTTEPTAEPTTEPTTEPSPTSTAVPTTEPSPAPTTTEPSPTPTESTATPSETTESETPSPTSSETTAVAQPTSTSTSVPAEGTGAESEGVPAWVWWLLAAIVVALAIAIPVLLRRRRMDAWLAELAKARSQVEWLARSLIPELRESGSREQAAGGWAVSSAQVVATEDRLTALTASAPDDVTRERSRILRDAVRSAGERLGAVTATGTDENLATDLDDIAGELEAALAATGPSGATGGPASTPGQPEA